MGQQLSFSGSSSNGSFPARVRAIDVARERLPAILDAAVRYPEALRYLLEHGVDVNSANEFGKTALMYAAQYDQPGAVELLLAHGADPNAATVWPDDDCRYTLETSRMTPLHYAARYASPRVIRLLLASGALTFNRTETRAGPLSRRSTG